MQVEPRMAQQPLPHCLGLVGCRHKSQIRCNSRPSGTAVSMSLSKRGNSWCRCLR
jgi:hypothetical protein